MTASVERSGIISEPEVMFDDAFAPARVGDRVVVADDKREIWLVLYARERDGMAVLSPFDALQLASRLLDTAYDHFARSSAAPNPEGNAGVAADPRCDARR